MKAPNANGDDEILTGVEFLADFFRWAGNVILIFDEIFANLLDF